MTSRFRSLILAFTASACGLLAGCADQPALAPRPQELVDAAVLPGFGAIRQWGDAPGVRSRMAWRTKRPLTVSPGMLWTGASPRPSR